MRRPVYSKPYTHQMCLYSEIYTHRRVNSQAVAERAFATFRRPGILKRNRGPWRNYDAAIVRVRMHPLLADVTQPLRVRRCRLVRCPLMTRSRSLSDTEATKGRPQTPKR